MICDLLDTHLNLVDTNIPIKHFVCLLDVFKTCLQDFFKICLPDVFKTCPLPKTSSRRLEDVFRVTIFSLPRRLQDVFGRGHVLRTS